MVSVLVKYAQQMAQFQRRKPHVNMLVHSIFQGKLEEQDNAFNVL